MFEPKDLIGKIHGGRVLDVATGTGGFIHFLLDGLMDYSEITGIDTSERAAAAFSAAFAGKSSIRFEPMDALHLTYPDHSFDTVSIANSLHHFEHPEAVLHEMARVLRPGGCLILMEMVCDSQQETQMTHVHLHHWWAAVDRACGIVHNQTYRRDEILALLDGWRILALHDFAFLEDDPKNPEIMAELGPVIDRYIQRAETDPDLQAQGEALRKRVEEVGFHSASSLLILATKPAENA